MSGNWVEEDVVPETRPTTAKQRRAQKRAMARLRQEEDDFVIHRREPPQQALQQVEAERQAFHWLKTAKIKPFSEKLETRDKFRTWLSYRRNITVQLEKCLLVGERALAAFVYGSAGTELEEIITSRKFLPEKDSVAEDFPFYTNLMSSLDKHFKEMSDPDIDHRVFAEMKQNETESIRDFHTRLIQQAEICGREAKDPSIRIQFLRGIRDQAYAKRAYTDGKSINEMIEALSRNEICA